MEESSLYAQESLLQIFNDQMDEVIELIAKVLINEMEQKWPPQDDKILTAIKKTIEGRYKNLDKQTAYRFTLFLKQQMFKIYIEYYTESYDSMAHCDKSGNDGISLSSAMGGN